MTNGACRSALGDSFHFEIQNQRDIKGLFRIFDKEMATTLLHASGIRDPESRQPWFVEPVSGDFGLPPSVLWIDALDDERRDGYPFCVRCMSTSGVIAGRFQLGFCVLPDDSRLYTRPSVWRVDQVPKEWQVDDAVDLLKCLDFSDVDVIAKEWRRSYTSWLVRAQYTGQDVLIQPVVPMPDGTKWEICIAKEARRRQNRPRIVSLKQETRIQFRGGVPALKPVRPDSPTDAPVWRDDSEALDAEMESDQTKRLKTPGAAPKAGASPASAPEHSYKGWMPRGATRQQNDGTGDCLFHSSQQALCNLEPHKPRAARQLRAFVVACMTRHSDEYKALWDGMAPGGAKRDPNWTGTFDDYLAGVQLTGCWCTYLECFAVAASLKRNIFVLADNGEVWHFEHEGNEPAICMYYSEAMQHYEYLAGPVESELRRWSKRHQGRGGAVVLGGGSDPLAALILRRHLSQSLRQTMSLRCTYRSLLLPKNLLPLCAPLVSGASAVDVR